MKRLIRIQPRSKAKVRDTITEKEEWWLFAGQNEAQIRTRLESEGYELIGTLQPYTLDDWNEHCEPARKALLEAEGKGFDYKGKEYWTDLKQFLFWLSDGCCAYCESRVRPTDKGAVEHFRPKAGVTGESDFPGYYWLAYDFENYLPACNNCNTSGKGNRFPLAPGSQRAHDPDSVPHEDPLLLNPFEFDLNEDPRDHFRFVDDTDPKRYGCIEGIDTYGGISVEVYGLNRRDLVKDRCAKYESVRVMIGNSRKFPQTMDQVLRTLSNGHGPLAEYLLVVQAAMRRELNELNAPKFAPVSLDQLGQMIAREVANRQARAGD
jgi:hypothetical protein